MRSNPEHKPYLSINKVYSRMRIYKTALHKLNDPKYIQMLVNPYKPSIAIRGCTKEDKLALRLKYSTRTRQSVEFISSYLVKMIVDISPAFREGIIFRIPGKYVEKENLIYFDLLQAENCAAEKEEQNE